MGSGRDEHRELTDELGRFIAAEGYHLLTGGGRGVMTSVSRSFAATAGREGLVLGILPGSARGESKPGYPNPYVELPIRTHLLPAPGEEAGPQSRNHINILTSDVIIALPGSVGTASEVELARRYGKPILAFVPDPGAIPGLAELDVPWTSSLDEVRDFISQKAPKTNAASG